MFTSFALLFRKEKYIKEKKQSVQDLNPPPSILVYTHVYFVHIYEYIYAEIKCIWILWALQVSRSDPWAHIQVPHVQCVCVYVYTVTGDVWGPCQMDHG